MTDLDLFKAIVRAVDRVPENRISEAVATVRALFAPVAESEMSRSVRGGRDRKYIGGIDRGVGGDEAA